MQDTLRPGLTAIMDYEVPVERTVPHLLPEAPHFREMPEVLATGYMVALIEWTCMQALDGHLSDGEKTVGVHVDLSHEGATPIGQPVHFKVKLTDVTERGKLTFAVEATDDKGFICRGTHGRAVIDVARFEASLDKRR